LIQVFKKTSVLGWESLGIWLD